MLRPRDDCTRLALVLCRNVASDPAIGKAYGRFLDDVFGAAPPRFGDPDPRWETFALFDPDGACVAGIETTALCLVLDGADTVVTAIRLVGVATPWRGRGLFRDLMMRALAWCEARAPGAPTLLYTEDDALYARFGFVPIVQHAFVGGAVATVRLPLARPLDRTAADAVIAGLAPDRAPVSEHCAMRGASDLVRCGLRDEDMRIAFAEPLDALLVYEMGEDELTVVDVVARSIPTMTQIAGVLASGDRRLRTLFPPDLLGWAGLPEPDDTGLMIRGRIPSAMRRPFMLPPTTSF